MIVLSWIMTLLINKKIALLFLIIIPLLGGTLIFIAKKAHPHFIKVFDEYDILNNSVQENVNASRVVKPLYGKITKLKNSMEFQNMSIHYLQKQKRSWHGTHRLCSLRSIRRCF